MHKINDLIREASQLPVEERVKIVDSLLRTINAPDPDIDQAWVKTAEKRLAELRAGRVKSIPGDEIFSKIKNRFPR
ncbi:MAG: addiction module protein [bacterium]